MFGLGLAGTGWLLHWILDSPSYFQLDLLSKLRADSGRLIIVELEKALIPATVALLRKTRTAKRMIFNFAENLVHP